MDFSLQRLDLTQIFCDVDDFYQSFEVFNARHIARLPYEGQAKRYQSRLSISEVMTIVIAFHGSGYKTFKAFYTQKVRPHWREAFIYNKLSLNPFCQGGFRRRLEEELIRTALTVREGRNNQPDVGFSFSFNNA